jgi:hypothetical protein
MDFQGLGQKKEALTIFYCQTQSTSFFVPLSTREREGLEFIKKYNIRT